MSHSHTPSQSDKSLEIARLVNSVEQLAEPDQQRILRIVSLLTRVPASVQQTTQRMLRDLLDTNPGSADECIEGVDELIEYLENEVIAHNGRLEPLETFDRLTGSGWTN